MTSTDHRRMRVGTRGSPLALAQARQVAGLLRERCSRTCVLVTMATPGDLSAAPVERLGTTGVFTTTLRAALLGGDVGRRRRGRRCRLPGQPGHGQSPGPPGQRSQAISAFFVACYAGLIIPVVGVGVASEFIGDFRAVLAFSILLAILCVFSLAGIRKTQSVP